MRLGRWDLGVRRAMLGTRDLQVHLSPRGIATALWDYGEEGLVDRALELGDRDLARIQRIAAVYEDPSYPLPITGQRITHHHVSALAAIAYFEGSLRPLAQTRRRPSKNRPLQLREGFPGMFPGMGG